ncbi:MAG TPA: DinB family protein [Chitinophagaceae bacterium]
MHSIATELENIIDERITALKKTTEDIFSAKPFPEKWSKKEIMGHLADSAQSNIRRFVVTQYEENPFIIYNQEKWVTIINYQQWKTADIIDLWYLLNKQICAILRNTPEAMYGRKCRTGELHTIEWLARDYVKHLLHHLHVVLNLEPIPYP